MESLYVIPHFWGLFNGVGSLSRDLDSNLLLTILGNHPQTSGHVDESLILLK